MIVFDRTDVSGHHQFASFIYCHFMRHRLIFSSVSKAYTLDIIISSIVLLLIELLRCLLIIVVIYKRTFGKRFSFCQLLILNLFNLRNPLRSIRVQLLLQNGLLFLLYLLLILFLLNLMFLLQFLVGRRLNVSNLESNSSNLYNVTFC